MPLGDQAHTTAHEASATRLLRFPPHSRLARYALLPMTLMEAKAVLQRHFVGNGAEAVTRSLTQQKRNLSGR